MDCSICPRHCAADRVNTLGFCHASLEPEVASICNHGGEEPPLCGKKGICNLFFAHCNLQCIFCQNDTISRGEVAPNHIFYHSIDEVVARVAEVLETSENVLGLVSPSHYAFCIPQLIDRLHEKGLFPTVVYNSNGYDDVAVLQRLAPYVDVYLPDFKYMDSRLAADLSHAADYPQRAQAALLEMYNQKGSGLPTDDDGLAFRGIIVRHLVLPGQVENSLRCLDWLAENVSLNLHISLMAQYFPNELVKQSPLVQQPIYEPLIRTLQADEYQRVVDHFYALGFHNGWVQELDSNLAFRPDFSRKDSF